MDSESLSIELRQNLSCAVETGRNHKSTSKKNTSACKISSGHLYQLGAYSHELMASQVIFENRLEDLAIKPETFIQIVQDRQHLLDQTFKKSFIMGAAGSSLIPAAHDLLSALIDGYRCSLTTFGKFCTYFSEKRVFPGAVLAAFVIYIY